MAKRVSDEAPTIGVDQIMDILHPVYLLARLLILSSFMEGFRLTGEDARSIGTIIAKTKVSLEGLIKGEE